MVLSITKSTTMFSISPMASKLLNFQSFSLQNHHAFTVPVPSKLPTNPNSAICFSVSGDANASLQSDVPFPLDYSHLLQQAKVAVDLAMKDNKQLMEIEFPTAGLASVPGDGEGGIEMTGSMQLIREFCDIFISSEKTTRTRIFFPEASEVDFARQSVFSGASFKLDYLTKPSFFEDFGFVKKVKMSDRVKEGDELFLVAYPYFNVNEMLVVEELYKEAVLNTDRKLIIFNGELDRIRSGFISLNVSRLSTILLSKACWTYKVISTWDGNCVLHS
ncbi:uncharacterized protein [Cicer arietinum]|uniref:Uncharacterized protein LOC101491104 isoform X2 n=1 Tax=Cicer arietinum TaxID=3827 RepID=A0A3Q7YEP7_CICAR|nr:uncharacterized protein LOC101491104 isoform X2 [Cicer arietinum]